MVGPVKLFYFCKSDVSAVQGHPRSLILAPVESAYATCRHSNFGPVLHRFGYIAGFLCSWPHPYSTVILGCFRCTRSPMLGSARAQALSYSAVKLFSKYSNLCDHGTWTSRTDERTDTSDRQTTYCRITADRAVKMEACRWENDCICKKACGAVTVACVCDTPIVCVARIAAETDQWNRVLAVDITAS